MQFIHNDLGNRKKGEIVKKVAEADLLPVFLEELDKLEAGRKQGK